MSTASPQEAASPSVSDVHELRPRPTFESEITAALEDFQSKATSIVGQYAKNVQLLFEDRFFEAYWNPENYAVFFDRYKSNRELNKELTQWATEDLAGRLGAFTQGRARRYRVFIESGSTAAALAPAWVRSLEQKPRLAGAVEFLTNNLFVLSALARADTSVAVTAGSLRSKYLAFLPFDDEDPFALETRDAVAIVRESDEYEILKRQFESCDEIYLAASEFGFLTGPFVGSRSNALFKHAIVTNPRCKNIRILIPEGKLLGDDNDGALHKFSESLKKAQGTGVGLCYPILALEPMRRSLIGGEPPQSVEGRKLYEVQNQDSFRPPAYSNVNTRGCPQDWFEALLQNPKIELTIGLPIVTSTDLAAMTKSANADLKRLALQRKSETCPAYEYARIVTSDKASLHRVTVSVRRTSDGSSVT